MVQELKPNIDRLVIDLIQESTMALKPLRLSWADSRIEQHGFGSPPFSPSGRRF